MYMTDQGPFKNSAHTYSVHTIIIMILINRTRAKYRARPVQLTAAVWDTSFAEIRTSKRALLAAHTASHRSTGLTACYSAHNAEQHGTWNLGTTCLTACCLSNSLPDSTCSNARQTQCKQKGDASDLKIMTLYMHAYWTLSPSDQTDILSKYTQMAPGLLDQTW